MKKALFILLIVFSLVIINEKQYYCEMTNENINQIEKFILTENEFDENGFKLEYKVNESKKIEINRIYNILAENELLKVVKDDMNITAYGENIKYNIKLYYYKESLKVDIVIVNKDKYKSINELKQLSYNIRNEKKYSQRYFSYIKVKINNIDTEILKTMEFNNLIKNVDGIDISNGKVYKAVTTNEIPINIGQINYNTGSYLIIGTPMIFITY